jgi:hypothetical protein
MDMRGRWGEWVKWERGKYKISPSPLLPSSYSFLCAVFSDKMTNFNSLNQFGNKIAVLNKIKFRRK